MFCVYYKFFFKFSYNIIIFDGFYIFFFYLKKQIMGREKLKIGNSDLQIINVETEEEYIDDNAFIFKNLFVIVRRIFVVGVKFKSKIYGISYIKLVMGIIKVVNDFFVFMFLVQFIEIVNLVEVNVFEEDKIKVMMI